MNTMICEFCGGTGAIYQFSEGDRYVYQHPSVNDCIKHLKFRDEKLTGTLKKIAYDPYVQGCILARNVLNELEIK